MNNKSDNKNYNFTSAIYIYIVGILFSIIYFYYIYSINTEQKFIFIILIIVIIILILNGYFSYQDTLKSFDAEISQYSYIEENARVILTSALAVAIFLKHTGINDNELTKLQKKSIFIPVVISFLFSCIILTIIWMPKHDSLYIRALRDCKTIFLTLSISSMIISMINTLYYYI